MKISELITKLENLKKLTGDIMLKEVKISYPYSTSHWRMYSPKRKTKSGERAYMNFNEYAEYIKKNGVNKDEVQDEN